MQPVVEVRRSGRERKPVYYVDVDDEDLDGRSSSRTIWSSSLVLVCLSIHISRCCELGSFFINPFFKEEFLHNLVKSVPTLAPGP
jgi:hypothetical protein